MKLASAIAVAALLASAPAALAANIPIYQTGLVTPGHPAVFATSGVVADNSTTPINFMRLVGTGLPLCINDSATSTYHQMCFGVLSTIAGATGAFITYNAYGGATPEGIYVNLNGVNYSFPGAGYGNVVGPTTAPAAGDLASWNGGLTLADSLIPISSIIAGPSTSTVGDVALFNNTTGTSLKDGGALGTMAFQAASGIAVTGGTMSGVAITGGSLSSASISSPTITNGTATGLRLATTPRTNNPTSAYTVQNSDCGGYLSLGGGAKWQLTFPSTGISSGCQVIVTNDDTHAKTVSGVATLASTYWIWPNQQLTFLYDGTTWQSNGPRRYTVSSSGPTVYIGPSGSCSDSNDGLASATPLCTANVAVNLIQTQFDCIGGYATQSISIANGTYNSFNLQFYGPTAPGCGDQITLTGNTGSPGSVQLNCLSTSYCFDVEDAAVMTIYGVQVNCASSSGGFFARQFAVIDLSNDSSNSCAGAYIVTAAQGGHVNILANGLTVYGSGAGVLYASGAGSYISATATSTVATVIVTSSPITLTNYAVATNLGEIDVGPHQVTGGGSVTGTEWQTAHLGLINTSSSGSACNSFFNNVGNGNGSSGDNSVCN